MVLQFQITTGTVKTIKSSGGTAAVTLASLPNGNGTSTGARQTATLDLGPAWAQWWRIDCDFELAPTPTDGNSINIFASYNNNTGAGKGNTSGTDSAYTGYNNNIDSSTRQLEPVGVHNCTSQATPDVQKSNIGTIFPKGRYVNFVIDNRSGAAFHNSNANQVITLTPLEQTVQDVT